MKSILTISLIQTELVWEDPAANRQVMTDWIKRQDDPVDVIILPEMFSTGFSMRASQLAEPMNGPTMDWMHRQAMQTGANLVGSLIIEEQGAYYNRLIWMCPNGTFDTYDKRHLFRMVGEDKVYTPGTTLLTVELKGWKIRPFICYDLRFPIWTRNLNNAYDLAIFIANWPEKRAVYWNHLLQARSTENQTWVVGVNRIGVDGNDHAYSGDSCVVDPWLNVAFHQSHTACMPTVHISAATLAECRQSFPAWMDADTELVQLPEERVFKAS